MKRASNTKDELEMLMNTEMAKICNWFTSNKLTLHPKKSKFIIHSKVKLVTKGQKYHKMWLWPSRGKCLSTRLAN